MVSRLSWSPPTASKCYWTAGPATDVSDVLALVRGLKDKWVTRLWTDNYGLWFRGQEDIDWSLLPAAYRREYPESDMLLDFEQRTSVLIEPRFNRSHYDAYAWAQHFGVPTRLLDWTRNLLVALYFAVRQSERAAIRRGVFDDLEKKGMLTAKGVKAAGSVQRPPAIWVLNPHWLNLISINDSSVIVPGGDFSNRWLPPPFTRDTKKNRFVFEKREYSRRLPLALSPIMVNPRLIAQSGRFTVHGSLRKPLESFCEAPKRNLHLGRIEIVADRKALDNICEELEILGIDRATLFPDIENVGATLREKYEKLED